MMKAAGQQPRRMAAQYRTWLGDVHSRLFGLRKKSTLTKEPLLQGLASPGRGRLPLVSKAQMPRHQEYRK